MLQKRTNADLVLVPSSYFKGQLDKGTIDSNQINQVLTESKIETIVAVVNGRNVKSLLQYLIFKSSCLYNLSYPQIFGMYVDYNRTNCLIQFLEYCTWYVSQSYVCKRWNLIHEQENYTILVEKNYFDQMPKVYFKYGYFEQEFRNELLVDLFFDKYSDEGIKEDSQTHYIKQKNSAGSFFICAAVLVVIGIYGKKKLAQSVKQVKPQDNEVSEKKKKDQAENSEVWVDEDE